MRGKNPYSDVVCVCVRVCACACIHSTMKDIEFVLGAANQVWEGIQARHGVTEKVSQADANPMFNDAKKFAQQIQESTIAPSPSFAASSTLLPLPTVSPATLGGSSGWGGGGGSRGRGKGTSVGSRVASTPASAPPPPSVSSAVGGGVGPGGGGGGRGWSGGVGEAGAGSPVGGAAPARNAGRGTSTSKKRQFEEDVNAGGRRFVGIFSLLSHRFNNHASH